MRSCEEASCISYASFSYYTLVMENNYIALGIDPG